MKSVVATWIVLILSVCCTSQPIVKIQQGFLRGTTLTSERSHEDFVAFMGIPYAKPPVGHLRFKAPQPLKPWDGIRDAVIEGPVCPQLGEFSNNNEGVEDCLFLNVYTPKLPNGSNHRLLPVMFSIHGGSFTFGSGARVTQGADYLVDDGVVVVTVNYRLGLLGFLSLQNAKVPGNYGLKDQVMALRWVQQNIAQFGGDPNKVTIFGISSGGVCVNLHMLSPMSQGLFHRAIAQSGTAFTPWAVNTRKDTLQLAFEAARLMGVNATTTEEVWRLLKDATLDQLWPAITGISTFAPVKDPMANKNEVFLPNDPKVLVNSGHISQVPFIAGFTSNEAIVTLVGLDKQPEVLINNSQTILTDYLKLEIDNRNRKDALSRIEEFYFEGHSGFNATLQENLNVISDTFFVIGAYCAAINQRQVSSAPVYMYQYSFSGNMSLFKILYGYPELEGASHADDLPDLYTTTFQNRTFVVGSPEYVTSQRMVKMWTNFAKTGNPTPVQDPLFQNKTWPRLTRSVTPVFNIDTDLTVLNPQSDLRNGSIKFWEELFRNYTSHSLCG